MNLRGFALDDKSGERLRMEACLTARNLGLRNVTGRNQSVNAALRQPGTITVHAPADFRDINPIRTAIIEVIGHARTPHIAFQGKGLGNRTGNNAKGKNQSCKAVKG